MAKDTIIVGGSIAGLMCGVMLKHHGYNVTILEKDTSSSREGYDAGVKIGPDVLDFLQKHDRVKRAMTITCTAPMKFNIEGKAKPEHSQTMVSTSWGLFVSVLRANFDGYTSKAVPIAPGSEKNDGKAVFRNGANVTNVRESNGTIEVDFEDADSRISQTIAANLVIVADGSTSSTRAILMPEVKRQYAGYVSWRGTVPEEAIDEEANNKYAQRLAFSLMDRSYILHYTIPTDDGAIEPGTRLHNWIWYQRVSDGSEAMEDIFTDVNGTKHLGTVPRGLLRPEVWEKQKAFTSSTIPAELARIIQRTSSPFVSKIYEVASSKALFFGGKLFVVGDAQYTIRPNAGASTTHAAHDCNKLEQVVEGKLSPEGWEKAVLRYGAAMQRFGMTIASYGLDSKITALWNALCWLLLLLGQKLGIV